MKQIFQNDWQDVLGDEFQKPYYLQLRAFLKEQYETATVYPNMHDLWSAFHATSYRDVKVVILGQDPYHGPNQAHGMSFSVLPGVPQPPSLRNMLQELQADIGCPVPNHGYLMHWAQQGVLLLNTVLTVRQGEAHSHKDRGWEQFTNTVIEKLNDRDEPVIFVLWGRPAQQKQALIDPTKHAVLTAPHPSPLSAHRGFFGSKPYSNINALLTKRGEQPIDWCLPNM